MRTRVFLVLLASIAFVCVLFSFGQDQSVADAARQSRLQKQKEIQSQDSAPTAAESQGKTHRVITNDEIPEHEGSASDRNPQPHRAVETLPVYPQGKLSAAEWKLQIRSQKSAIAALENEIARLSASIHFPVSCLRNCPERTERQLQKENRVEIMKTQLEQQQKHLEEMQESARRQGFGNSVYDP